MYCALLYYQDIHIDIRLPAYFLNLKRYFRSFPDLQSSFLKLIAVIIIAEIDTDQSLLKTGLYECYQFSGTFIIVYKSRLVGL